MICPCQKEIKLNKLFRKIIAFLRLNDQIVCKESKNKDLIDYHDYPDSIEGEPWHFVKLTCKRCNKQFTI